MIQYFVSWQPLDVVRGATLQWSNIISLFIWIYATVLLIANNVRRIVMGRARASTHRDWYESIIIIVTFGIFIALGFTEPGKLDQSALFTTYYTILIGAIYLGSEATGITHTTYNIWRRIVTSSLTPEILAFLFVFFFKTMRQMSLVVWAVPQVAIIGDWISLAPFTSSYRAITLGAAIGTLVLSIRALVGREAGLIEAEIV
jgi:hypothetical protein